MSKQVFSDKESLAKVLKGLNIAGDAVGETLGPCGTNVFLDQGIPKITNDGATIANETVLEDKLENIGAYIIRNTSAQTNDDAGDGTTTTAVLVQSIVNESLKRPENPMRIRESLQQAGIKILKTLKTKSKKLDKKDIEKVALISAEDKNLAKLITEIIEKLGDKAVINVEDSKTFSTEYEITDGYEVHLGFMSPKFINDKKTAKAVYIDIPILCTEKKISNIADIGKIFNDFAFTVKDGQKVSHPEPITSCVIVCDDIDDSMLGMFVANFEMKTFNALVIKATSLFLEDIAGYTGATLISNSTGVNFQNFTRKHLGFCKKVVSDANKTLFIGNGFSHKQYVKELETKADGEPNMYTQRNMKQRIAKLKGGIAVLKIGASTDFDRDYLKYKAEDTVKAVQCAIEEGVVEGGGMTLYRIASDLKPKTIGEEILKKSLTAPLRRIIENAGQDYAEIIKNMPEGMGYNAKNNTYVDMIKVGIIDPMKVERVAIENSISAASTFITTKTFICEYAEHKETGTKNS